MSPKITSPRPYSTSFQPLADIDLFIDKPEYIPALRGLISKHIPLSGFFRWEYSSEIEIDWFGSGRISRY